MTKTFDNIRRGTVMHLAIKTIDDDIRENLSVEMEWAKKWAVVKVISENKVRIRSLKLRRDVVVYRNIFGITLGISYSYWTTSKDFEAEDFVFMPTADIEWMIPEPDKFLPRKTSVDISDGNALKYITDYTDTYIGEIFNEAVRVEVGNIIKCQAAKASEKYKEKTGIIPAYFTVFNSVVSPDFGFLRELKSKYGGRVELDHMRWIAFDGDDLIYSPKYTDD